MTEKKKRNRGRTPKNDPAVFRYTVRFNAEEHNRFLSMFERSGVSARSVFIKAHFFGQQFKVLAVDKTFVEYYTKLSDFHAQYRAIGTNYNQVVKELKSHFSEKKAMALLYKLEKSTLELVALSHQIVQLSHKNGGGMVAKISLGSSLYGALAYNGEKINKGKGKLLTTHKIYNDGSGTVDIHRAMEDFGRFMPSNIRTEKPILHISLNPHPDDCLTDTDLIDIALEYLNKLGYGNQPYMIYKHEDIERHHLHIVTVNVDERGKRLNQDFLFRRSDRVRKELEEKYGLHKAEKRRNLQENPLRKVDISAGDVRKQVANTVKAVLTSYHFQSMGEYRALLSLYNVAVEEPRGIVNGREYHGLVYSATDDVGNKVSNPFKSSRLGKGTGYESVEARCSKSKEYIKEKNLTDMAKRTILAILRKTNHREKFVQLLLDKGVNTVFRFTETGRIYGATFIDHRTGCVLNGSRMGKELSANALQEHFTLPFAGEKPIPFTLSTDGLSQTVLDNTIDSEWEYSSGLGLFSGDNSRTDAQEEAFARNLKRKKKKKNQRKI